MLLPASSNRSKNSRSRGAKSWERRAIPASVCNRLVYASGNRARLPAHCGLQPVELLRGDAVGVLRAGERARADLLGVGRHAADHLLADRRVLLDELRLEAGVDRQQ